MPCVIYVECHCAECRGAHLCCLVVKSIIPFYLAISFNCCFSFYPSLFFFPSLPPSLAFFLSVFLSLSFFPKLSWARPGDDYIKTFFRCRCRSSYNKLARPPRPILGQVSHLFIRQSAHPKRDHEALHSNTGSA